MRSLLLYLKSYQVAWFLFFLSQLIQCIVNDLNLQSNLAVELRLHLIDVILVV